MPGILYISALGRYLALSVRLHPKSLSVRVMSATIRLHGDMNMRIRLIEKTELSEQQLEAVSERLTAPEPRNDKGPIQCWHSYPPHTMYAFFHCKTGGVVGVADASGPANQVNAGWWIDLDYRGKGHGRELVVLLAAKLKSKGYRGVGGIKVDTWQGKYDAASRRLREIFTAQFRAGDELPAVDRG